MSAAPVNYTAELELVFEEMPDIVPLEESSVEIAMGRRAASSETGTISDVTSEVAYVQHNYIKLSGSGNDEATLYYYATLVENAGITADQVVNSGRVANAGEFEQIRDKNGTVVKPGYSGGNIYLYAVEVIGEQKSEVVSATYPVKELSYTISDITASPQGPYLVSDTVTFTFKLNANLPLVTDVKCYYQIDSAEKIELTDPTATMTSEIKMSDLSAGTHTLTYYIELENDTNNEYGKSTALSFTVAEDTQDLCLSYGENSSETFAAAELSRIGSFLTENSITEATLTLLNDVAPEMFTTSLTIPKNTSLTIDLAGHAMTSKTSGVGLKLAGEGSGITIQDLSESKTGSIATTGSALQVAANGTSTNPVKIDVASGLLKSTAAVVNANSKSYVEVNVSGGTLEVTGSAAVIDARAANNTVTVRGGTFKGLSSYVFRLNNAESTLTIEDCDASATGAVFYGGNSKITIGGGTFTSTGSMMAESFTDATINGGKFFCNTTDLATAFYTYGSAINCPEGHYFGYSETDKCFMLLMKPVTQDQGSLSVTSSDGETTTYTSVADAFAAAKNGGTIQLTGDSSLVNGDSLTLEADATLDLNGHTLTLTPFTTSVSSGAIHIASVVDSSTGLAKASKLTIKDGRSGGRLVFGNGTQYGITLGAAASFSLQSGTISGGDSRTVLMSQGMWSGKIEISGGIIAPSMDGTAVGAAVTFGEYGAFGKIVVSGNAEITTTGAGIGIATTYIPVEIQSGTITAAHGEALQVAVADCTITGGTISGSGTNVVSFTKEGTREVSGSAKICAIGTGEYAIYLDDHDENILTIDNDAVISGKKYAIYNQIIADTHATVNVNGGHFQYEELPFSSSAAVTYKTENEDTYILAPTKGTDEAYPAYYSLVTRDSLKWEDTTTTPPTQKTYQDFEQMNYTISAAKATLENESMYTADTVEAVKNALSTAEATLINTNANQAEINYFEQKLSDAVAGLVGTSDLDPDSLQDGTYEVDVAMRMAGLTNPSMTSAAVNGTATLKIAGSQRTLILTFRPALVMNLWGHLTQMWYYKGESTTEARLNSKSWSGDTGTRYTYMDDTYILSYYAPDPNDPSKAIPCEDGHVHDSNCYPYAIEIPLNYISSADGENIYVLRVSVDQMTANGVGDQNVDCYVKWGTLKAVDIKDTLSVSDTEIGLSTHEAGTNSKSVTAQVIGTTGWEISCVANPLSSNQSSSIADVIVDGNKITFTAKEVGTCDFTVIAQKEGATDLSQSITVTVTDQKPAAVTTTTSNGTASISITGGTLIGAGDMIEVSDSKITINAKTSDGNVDGAEISLAADTMKALAAEGKSVAIVTDVGTITLDSDAASSAANSSQEIKLTMNEVDAPDIDGVDDSDFDAAYELTMRYGSSSRSNLGGDVTITVPWSGSVGYAYYVDGDELAERYTMTVGSSTASWVTDHFSTWALSTDRNLMEVGITEGVYSVPIRIKNSSNTNIDSMANDATGDMVVADVDEDGVTYTMFLKARIGDELGGDSLRGHLLKMWYYAPDDTSLSNPIRATVVRTYQDKDMYGEIDTFPREVEVYQEGDPNEEYYIQVSVDAMGGDSALQNALVKLDWDNALDDGGEAAREGFEDEYATEQVIDSGDSVSRSDLKDWIDNECILLVQGRDSDLTAYFDTDALEDIYGQTSSSVKFVLEELKKSKLSDEQQEVAGDRPIYQLKITSGSKTITEIDDGNVEVTFPYELEEDEVKEGLLIQLVDDDGDVQKIKCSYSTKGETVSFDTTNFGIFVIGYDADQIWENPFTDVKEEDWFYEAVKYVVQKGLFAGTSETTFEPNLTMTRSMLVTVLYRLAGSPVVEGTSKVSDVAPNAYYTDAVIWATQNGIVGGYDNGQFGTNDPVSREQMATILYRYAQHMEYDVSLVKGLNDYTDSNQVSSYAVRAMQWAVANGIINGTSSTTLSPQGSATRSQVAVILMRFDEEIAVPAEQQKEEGTKTK
ncbi:S-layer homology domain-containing protein [Pseudoflavonifractor sp. P01025]|uniref:S-layer homology domain-containing protein n=1 Tax=Flintibacter porci TaxID=3342383 RepID=UPI0035B6774A